jgi:hypothetical protein
VKPPTQRSEEFLRQYRRYGSGLSLGQFCRRYGFAQTSVEGWLAEIEGFKEAYEQVGLEHAGSPTTTAAGLMKFGLSEEQGQFLSHYRESHQRKVAMDLVQWTPRDLLDAQKNPVFCEEMNLIRQEIQIMAEDQLGLKAMAGSLGHQKLFLEAVDPEHYAKKINHRVSGNVKFLPNSMQDRKAFWANRLQGQLPAAKPAPEPAEEVVDAEYAVTGEPN